MYILSIYMNINKNIRQEQIVRRVALIGNGAHVFTPKVWAGEEVIIIRNQKTPKEKILDVLNPYLENILGVYLYGSYARGENEIDSDIDLLIITDKKIKIKKIGFEIVAIEKDFIPKAIKIAPVLIYSAIIEAKPIINSKLLAELKEKYKPKLKDFEEYLTETKNIIEINQKILDPYSLILRLRGIFIINQILQNKSYSHKNFKLWISEHSSVDYKPIYQAYKDFKRKSKIRNVEINDLNKLLELLREETLKLEEKIYEKRKKTAKRN